MSSPESKQVVIGLVGNAASGKDYVASVFEKKSFVHFSTSDLLREEIIERGLTPSRALQTKIANETRSLKGSTYFVEESMRRVNSTAKPERLVLSGIYAVSEGEYIVKVLGGHLVAVVTQAEQDDDIKMRFDRLSKRADGSRDNLTFEEFEAAHLRENTSVLNAEANVGRLMSLARFTIVNAAGITPESINSQVQSIIESVECGVKI